MPKVVADLAEYMAARTMPEPNSGCWLWCGEVNPKGYGRVTLVLNGRTGRGAARRLMAHRLSYEQHKGPIPAGLLVLHRCDNPPCVNPGHLFVGTARDNLHDMIRKGRGWKQQAALRRGAIEISRVPRTKRPRRPNKRVCAAALMNDLVARLLAGDDPRTLATILKEAA